MYFGDMCPPHAALTGVRVGASKTCAGLGLFAVDGNPSRSNGSSSSRPIVFRRGEVICEYGGRLINAVQQKLLEEEEDCGDYTIELGKGWFIDGRLSCSGFARFANDASGGTNQKLPAVPHNAEFVVVEQKSSCLQASQRVLDRVGLSVVLEAVADIRDGDEIVTTYGEGYWGNSPSAPTSSSTRPQTTTKA